VTQVCIFNVSTGAQTKFVPEQITQVNRHSSFEDNSLRSGERVHCCWRRRMRQGAEQRLGIGTKKAFLLRPHAVPRREDQEFIVFASILTNGQVRDRGSKAKNLLEVRSVILFLVSFFAAQTAAF